MSDDTIRGGSRADRRRRAKHAAKAAPEPENNDPLAGIRFRVCTCTPTDYSDHAECVRTTEGTE